MYKEKRVTSGSAAVVRSLVFLSIWFVLYGPDLAALPVGIGAAVAATWTRLASGYCLRGPSAHGWGLCLFWHIFQVAQLDQGITVYASEADAL
jgi:hypothetical protein